MTTRPGGRDAVSPPADTTLSAPPLSGVWPRQLRHTLLYLAATLLLLLFCGPIVWMVGQSLRGIDEVIANPYDLVPRHFTLGAFSSALGGGSDGTIALAQNFLNSTLYAGVSVCGNVLLGVPAGYAFARLRFPLRRLLFALVVVAMVVPTAAIVIPLFVVIRVAAIGGGGLGWLNTYQGLILPTAVTGLTIVLVRQFLRGIPRELDEAAQIDGCGVYRTFLYVILPLSGPAVASVATLTFLARWDDYLWPSVAAVTPDMFTLQVGLRSIEGNGAYAQQWPLLMACCVLAALPIVVMYVVLQPLFDRGLASLGTGWEW